ncbi:HK97 family phage prohead protease [Sphingobacterium multivorum]|uniref:HK97 family phage prohead protease n=1 Tax=Sphingobacterium multivorum TaxID=28454 RepID=UPI0028AF7987|nr:HK97 family phage prohead protease [Sphingobacterium multivorum]
MAKTFVLNDEKQTNSYGFRIMNSGINLDRFKSNPVMLSNHWNNTDNVIGRWENVRIEGSQLLADAVFDENDEDAKKIASKVEGGFLRGCSMGIRFSYEYMEEKPDGTYWLMQSELFEVSIVAVPSNANAVKLYSITGELIDDEQITLSLQSIKHSINENSNSTMSKLLLSAVTVATLMGFGLKDAESPSDVDNAVAKLKAELDSEKNAHGLEKTAREALESKIKDQETAQLNALLDQAVIDGQILGDQKSNFAALGFDGAKKIISGLPKKVNLSGNVTNHGSSDGVEPKTRDEFEKMSFEAKLAFKDSNPEGYKKLFAQ